MLRQAVFCGPTASFYHDDPDLLDREIREMLGTSRGEEKALGIVVPHAGYQFSGPVAAGVFARVAIPPLVIMLGPNHTGNGAEFALYPTGAWETPLGRVEVAPEARDLLAASEILESDTLAHLGEHSLEVQLPFLQVAARGPFRIIPIALASCESQVLIALGEEIASFLGSHDTEALLLASSDMSHFEDEETSRRKDAWALQAVENLEPLDLLRRVRQKRISMCGAGPVAVMLSAARELGASGAELVSYTTSGEVTGDYRRVVGYAGLIVT